jgi:hypothetical protein
MSKFYQQPSPNPDTILFHHDLIRILVKFHLVSAGDTWQGVLVRNEFLPPQIDPTIYLTHGVEEPVSPKASPNSPHDFLIEIHIQNDSIISPDDQTKSFPMTRLAPKRHDFVPKKPLEDVLSHLRNGSLNVTDQS